MRNSTKKIAEKFKELFEAEEVEVAIFNADKTDENEILILLKHQMRFYLEHQQNMVI